MNVIPLVDGVDLACFREFHIRVGKVESSNGRVEGEAIHAMSCSINQHGGGAIDNVAGGDLAAPRLKTVLQHAALVPGDLLQNREDGPDGDIDVDVR